MRDSVSGSRRRPNASSVDLYVAPLRLCTDNAVMGAIAVERLKAGRVEGLDLDVFPGVVRGARHPERSEGSRPEKS